MVGGTEVMPPIEVKAARMRLCVRFDDDTSQERHDLHKPSLFHGYSQSVEAETWVARC